MISKERFLGGANVIPVTSNIDLSIHLGRVKVLDVQLPGLIGVLPVVSPPLRAGGPVFLLYNTGTQFLTIQNKLGIHVGVLNAGQKCVVLLWDHQDYVGSWAMACRGYIPEGGTTTTSTTSTTTSTSTITCTTQGCIGLVGVNECRTSDYPDLTQSTSTTAGGSTLSAAPAKGEWHYPNARFLLNRPHVEEGI